MHRTTACVILLLLGLVGAGACSREGERNPLTGDPDAVPAGMVEMNVMAIAMDPNSLAVSVILSDLEEERAVVITIGDCEAQAIALKLQDIVMERPMTHDLLKSTIEGMNGTVDWIAVTEIRGDIYIAEIAVQRKSLAPLRIDARPSDAIALALRTSAPIYVADELVQQFGIPIPREKTVPAPEQRGGLPGLSLSLHTGRSVRG